MEIEDEKKVQVALDSVNAVGLYDNKRFYKLGIEQLRDGENADVGSVRDHFLKKYAGLIHYAPDPKWIKALKLYRGKDYPAAT